MEGKGEEKRNQGGKLVAKGKSGSEERLFGSFSNYKMSKSPRRDSSSELPVAVVTPVFIKVSLATGKQAQPNASHLFGFESHLLL